MTTPNTVLVTRGGWNVSYTSPADRDAQGRGSGVRLSVSRLLREGILPVFAKPGDITYLARHGDGDGLVFATTDEARRWALAHGYLQPFVSEWCPRCRVRHTSVGGGRSGFCHRHSRSCSRLHTAPRRLPQ